MSASAGNALLSVSAPHGIVSPRLRTRRLGQDATLQIPAITEVHDRPYQPHQQQVGGNSGSDKSSGVQVNSHTSLPLSSSSRHRRHQSDSPVIRSMNSRSRNSSGSNDLHPSSSQKQPFRIVHRRHASLAAAVTAATSGSSRQSPASIERRLADASDLSILRAQGRLFRSLTTPCVPGDLMTPSPPKRVSRSLLTSAPGSKKSSSRSSPLVRSSVNSSNHAREVSTSEFALSTSHPHQSTLHVTFATTTSDGRIVQSSPQRTQTRSSFPGIRSEITQLTPSNDGRWQEQYYDIYTVFVADLRSFISFLRDAIRQPSEEPATSQLQPNLTTAATIDPSYPTVISSSNPPLSPLHLTVVLIEIQHLIRVIQFAFQFLEVGRRKPLAGSKGGRKGTEMVGASSSVGENSTTLSRVSSSHSLSSSSSSTSASSAANTNNNTNNNTNSSPRFTPSELRDWRTSLSLELFIAPWSATEWSAAEEGIEGAVNLVKNRILDVSDRMATIYLSIDELRNSSPSSSGSSSGSSNPAAAASSPNNTPPSSSSTLSSSSSSAAELATLTDDLLYIQADFSALFHCYMLYDRHIEQAIVEEEKEKKREEVENKVIDSHLLDATAPASGEHTRPSTPSSSTSGVVREPLFHSEFHGPTTTPPILTPMTMQHALTIGSGSTNGGSVTRTLSERGSNQQVRPPQHRHNRSGSNGAVAPFPSTPPPHTTTSSFHHPSPLLRVRVASTTNSVNSGGPFTLPFSETNLTSPDAVSLRLANLALYDSTPSVVTTPSMKKPLPPLPMGVGLQAGGGMNAHKEGEEDEEEKGEVKNPSHDTKDKNTRPKTKQSWFSRFLCGCRSPASDSLNSMTRQRLTPSTPQQQSQQSDQQPRHAPPSTEVGYSTRTLQNLEATPMSSVQKRDPTVGASPNTHATYLHL